MSVPVPVLDRDEAHARLHQAARHDAALSQTVSAVLVSKGRVFLGNVEGLLRLGTRDQIEGLLVESVRRANFPVHVGLSGLLIPVEAADERPPVLETMGV